MATESLYLNEGIHNKSIGRGRIHRPFHEMKGEEILHAEVDNGEVSV